MKVIFLDIDGVLNWVGTADRIDGFIGLDPSRIAKFNNIIEAVPEAKIVISSTWRKVPPFQTSYSDFDGLKALLASRGLKGEIVGLTPICFGQRARGDEIREWIEDYEEDGGELTDFVVLDDDTEAMEGYSFEEYVGLEDGEDVYETIVKRDLSSHQVVTYWDYDPNTDDEQGGLQDRHVEQAIAILQGTK